jgi:hypothetical protein
MFIYIYIHMYRYTTALRGRDEDVDEEAVQSKYEEIRAVCSEFLTIATADAMIILSENFLSPFQKTIPVGTETTVGGYRGMTCTYMYASPFKYVFVCMYVYIYKYEDYTSWDEDCRRRV